MSPEQRRVLGHGSDVQRPTVHESWLLLPKPSSSQSEWMLPSRKGREGLGSGLTDTLVLGSALAYFWNLAFLGEPTFTESHFLPY